MKKSDVSVKKPLIGFFPCFNGIGETYPLVKIAKKYVELGGKVIFFSHGGKYEYLAKDKGFKIKRIKPIANGGVISKYFLEQSDENIIKIVRAEAKIYRKTGIKALVQTNVYFGSILAPRLENIPLISVCSGGIPPYFKANYATYPDNTENSFTCLIPRYIKNRFVNWAALNHKTSIIRKFNKISKKLNLNLYFKNTSEMSLGDYTFVCDSMEFLGLSPTEDFPAENYIGPILSDERNNSKPDKFDADIKKHLQRPGKSILLTMGSSFVMKELFLRILKTLNKTKYNIIATYTSILNEDEIPKLNDNILLKKFIPNIDTLIRNVDLAIIHGGRGTVHTVAYSGKPAIGIPLHSEQQNNLENLKRRGGALTLSKTFFQEEKLLSAIKEIFDNYILYLKNGQALARMLPKPEGDKNAAKRIIEILEQV